jgi:hypothetical protein
MTPQEDGVRGQLDEPPGPGPSGIHRLFSRLRQRSSSPSAVLPEVKPDLLERLTPTALKALALAHDEAKTLGHRTVGTEHLLLALTRDPELTAYPVLEQLGAAPATIRAEVLAVVVPGRGVGAEVLPCTPRARLALELAHRASTRIGVPQTGTEHLLIGLAAESEGIAARTLRKFGISAKAAEHQVTTNLDGKNDDPSDDGRRKFAEELCAAGVSESGKHQATADLDGHGANQPDASQSFAPLRMARSQAERSPAEAGSSLPSAHSS